MIGRICAAVWLTLAATPAAADPARAAVRTLPGTRAAAATLIVQGIEGGGLPFAAVAVAERAVELDGSDHWRLPVVFELPASLPVAAGSELELYVYALAPGGAVAAHRGLALALSDTGGAGVRAMTHLELAAGEYALRFLVLDPASHQSGLARQRVEVGASSELTPRVEDRCRAWAVATTGDPGQPAISARPVLLRDRPVELSTHGGAPSLEVRLTPTSAEATEPQVLQARAAGETTDGRSRWRFELPPIGRGVWSLRLGSADGSRLSEPIQVWVIDVDDLAGPEDDPCSRTWTAVLARAARAPGAPPAARDSSDVRRSHKGRVKNAYGEVLAHLASTGDIDSAARELCDLERRLADELTHLPVLLRGELEVTRRLAGREPEVLAPLMLLHHEAYLEHRRRDLFALAGHSARVVRSIGDLLLERQEQPDSRRVASHILTSLAEYGHRNRSFIPSQRLLESALAVEAENTDALKLLAVNYEWFGRYEDAISLLERLVDLSAADREARLRLGVLLGRSGRGTGAESQLRRILTEGAEPWVLSIAYQALANLLADSDRLGEAMELLERGRTRLPADQRLHLLSGHLLERSGRTAEARRLFEALPIDGTAVSPRLRYGESLTEPLEALRADIRRAASVRLPLLARAIGDGRHRQGAR